MKMKNIKTYLLMAAVDSSTTSCLDKYPDDMVPSDKAITTVDRSRPGRYRYLFFPG